MDFRVFYVVAIEVEKRRSGKNGGKWLKMGCRGYLVGNGFPRVLRHSPTTNTTIPSREQCIDDMKGEMMPQDEYDHMVKLWKTFDIKTWGEYYELYNVLDVTLMADAFEHFRVTTLNAFGVDPMHSITAPQMAYSLFLKVTMEGIHNDTT